MAALPNAVMVPVSFMPNAMLQGKTNPRSPQQYRSTDVASVYMQTGTWVYSTSRRFPALSDKSRCGKVLIIELSHRLLSRTKP